MKIKLEEVRKAFSILDAVTATPAFDSSTFVRFRCEKNKLTLAMTGTLWVAFTLKGEGTWEWFVERRLLKAFLKTAVGDVDIEMKDKFLLLRAGQQLKIPQHAAISGYETWVPKTEFALTDAHRALLPTLVKYCSNLAGMEYVNAIRFAPGFGVLGTDTIFIAMEHDLKAKEDLILPPEIAALALSNPTAKLCFDNNGAGLDFGNGFVYQPFNDELKRYPLDKLKEVALEVFKSKPSATLMAAELHETLSAMKEFLLEQSADKAAITPDTNRLVLSIVVNGSKIQRAVALKSGVVEGKPSWVIERLLPWLGYVKQLDPDAELEYIALRDMSAFRYQNSMIVFANI
jgi:hypothetical protein